MSSKDVLKLIKDKQVEFVDLRFTDPKGKLQHLTMDSTVVDEDMLENGVFFDGSSIAGWKAINESDMILKPDLARPIIDPFNSHTTVNIFCDILDAVKKDSYGRDPRGTAKKAEEYLKKSGIGDKSYFGPEPEFFVFDDVRIKTSQNLKDKIFNLFINLNNSLDKNKVKNDFEILSVLRNLKIIGIFTRLAVRDRKKKYMKMIPYAWKMIEHRVSKNS